MFDHAISIPSPEQTLDGESHRMKRRNPISWKGVGFCFSRKQTQRNRMQRGYPHPDYPALGEMKGGEEGGDTRQEER
jgi:hypothetical protein